MTHQNNQNGHARDRHSLSGPWSRGCGDRLAWPLLVAIDIESGRGAPLAVERLSGRALPSAGSIEGSP